jgi:hypothetical protein
MKKILLFIFSLLIFSASVNAQSLSGQMYGNNAGNTSMLSFSAAEPMVGGFPASGVGLLSGGQYAASPSSFYSTVADGNWTDPSVWFGGVIPIAGVNVEIHHNVSLSIAALTYNSITISGTGQLTMNNAYFAIDASFTNDGTFTQNGSSNIEFVNDVLYTNNGTHNINTSSVAIYCNEPASAFINTVTGVLNINTPSSEIAIYGANTFFTNNGTLHIGDGAELSFANTANNATLTFASGSTNTFDDGSTIEITNTATINKNTNLSFSNLILYNITTFAGTGTTSILKELTVSNNTAVSGTTFEYQNNSKLKIFTTTFSTYNVPTSIWTPNLSYTSTNGVPYNVNFASSFGKITLAAGNDWKLGNSAVVSGNDTVIFHGNFELDSLAIQTGSKIRSNGEIEVGGSLVVDGSLTLQSGYTGNLEVKEDVLLGATGAIIYNNRKLVLSGTATQKLNSLSGTFTAAKLEINKASGDVELQSNLVLNATSGTLLDFQTPTILETFGLPINLNNSGLGIINCDANATIKGSGYTADNNVYLNGPTTFQGTGKVVFSSISFLEVKLTAVAAYNFGASKAEFDSYTCLSIENSGAVVNGTPKYNTGGRLVYRFNGTKTVGNEWANVCTGADNIPWGVDYYGFTTHTVFPSGANCYYIGTGGVRMYQGTLEFDNASVQELQIEGDFYAGGSGNLVTYSQSTISFVGSANRSFEFPIGTELNKLKVAKSASAAVQLSSNINCKTLEFVSGNLDLNGNNNITLNSAGSIVNETGGNAIINSGSPTLGNGYIRFDVPADLDLTLTNYGGLGLQLASSETTGAVNVKRFPKRQTGFGGNALGSLDRVFAVTIANASQITAIYSYFDEELNGIDETVQNFYLWTSNTQNSGYVIDPGLNIQAPATNEIFAGFGSFNAGTTFIAANTQGLAPIVTIANGNWSDGNTWLGGIPPTNAFGNPKALIDHNVTVDIPYNISETINGLQINAGKTLTFATGTSLFVGDSIQNNGTLVMDANSVLNLENLDHKFKNAGTFTATSPSTVSFATNGKIVGNATFSVLKTNGNLEFSNATSINDSLVFKQLGATVGAEKPTYNTNSWLVYAGGTKDRGAEWSSTSGAGYPNNVRIITGASISIAGLTPAVNRAIAGDVQVDNGVFNIEGLTANLTVGSMHVNSGGQARLSRESGSKLIINNGNLYSYNWEQVISGDVNSTIEFIGASNTQTLSGYVYMYGTTVIVNKSGGSNLQIADNAILEWNNEGLLSFPTTSGINLGVNSRIALLNGTDVNFGLGTRTISGDATSQIWNWGGVNNYSFSRTAGSGDLIIDVNYVINPTINATTVNMDFGNGIITINKELSITNLDVGNITNTTGYPNYGSNSTVTYTYGGNNHIVGSWWQPCGSPGGVPNNVVISNLVTPATVSFPTNNYCVNGNYTQSNNSSNGGTLALNASSQLRVQGNVTIAAGETLNTSLNSLLLNGTTSEQNLSFSTSPVSNIILNNTNGAKLLSNLNLEGNFTFVNGNLDLNGAHVVDMSSTSNIIGETATRTFINSNFTLSGYIQYTGNVIVGPNTLAGTRLSFNSSGAGNITLRRIPSYNGLVGLGRQAVNNIYGFESNTSSLDGQLSIDYSIFNLNGNTPGSMNFWSSLTGGNISYTMVAAASDVANTATQALTTFNAAELKYYAIAEPAIVGILKTTNTDGGSWTNPAHWTPAGVPSPADRIVINNTNFLMNDATLTQNDAFDTLRVQTGKSLIVSANNKVYFSNGINNNGTITTQSNSSIICLGSVLFQNLGSYNTVSPSNLNLQDGGSITGNAIDFSGLTSGGPLSVSIPSVTIKDTLKLVELGVYNGPTVPVYNSGSSLVYSNANSTSAWRGLEWSAVGEGTIGVTPGFPYDLIIRGNTQLYLGNIQPTVPRAIANKLYAGVGSSWGVLNLYDMLATVTVKHLSLSSQILVPFAAPGKLVVKDGDAYCAPGGFIQSHSAAATFEMFSTTSTQHFEGNWKFDNFNIILNNSFDDIRTTTASNNEIFGNIYFNTNKGTRGITWNIVDNTTINLAAGNRKVAGDINTWNTSITNFVGTGSLTIEGNLNVGVNFNSSSINLGINKLIMDTATLSIGGNATVLGGYPTYNPNSTLYEFRRLAPGSEWQPGNGAGSPFNVYIEAGDYGSSNQFVLPSGNYYVKKNLTYERYGIPPLAEPDLGVAGTNLFVAGDITNANYGRFAFPGTLTLNGTTNQSIELSNGNVSAPFNNITINKSAGNAIFSNNVTRLLVNGNLTFTSGNLDLNGKVLDLGSTGTIVNENNNRRILSGSSGAYVITQRTFGNTISLGNSGNIGIIVNATAPIGLATIERYIEDVNNITAGNSIGRIYEIVSPTLVVGSVALKYFSSELNGNAANGNMKVFRSSNFGNGYLPSPLTNNTYPAAPAAYTSAEQTSFSFPDASVSYFTAANTDLAYSGVYALPGPTFATLSDAFVQLNTSGIAGNVTINITPNYSEQLTQPIIFDFLNNPPNAGSTLTIQGDPDFPATFIAPLGGTLDRDAAIYILGTDYFTLQNFNLIANPTAANNNQRLEWGIAILKKTATNGCQNVNLNNWDINLSKLDTVATGVYIGNHSYNPLTPLAPIVPMNVSNVNGTNREIRIKSSTIRNVNRGIVHRGFSTTNSSFLDNNIAIGDTADVAQGNIIENLGGIAYPATAIDIRHARDIIIGNNTIDNAANGGSLAEDRITGIELAGFTRGYNAISRNSISLKQTTSSGNVRGINNRMSSSVAKTSIRKNLIQNSETGPNSTGNFYGISNEAPGVFNLLIDSNRVVNNTIINTSGSVFAIHNESNSERVLIFGDTIRNFSSSTTGNMYGIYNQSGADSNKVQQNVLVNLSKTGDGGFLYGYYNGSISGMVAMGESGGVDASVLAGLKKERVIDNKIYSLSVFGSTKVSGITSDGRNSFQKDVDNNVIRNLSSENGELRGIDINEGQSINVNGNSLSNFTSQAIIKGISTTEGVVLMLDNDSIFDINQGGNENAYAIFHTQTTAGPHTKTFRNNDIINVTNSGGSGSLYGIYHTGSGTGSTAMTVNNNGIDNIDNSGAGAAFGIYHTGSGSGGPHNVNSITNTIGNVSSSGAGAAYGIYHTGSGSGGPHVYVDNGNTINNISNSSTASAYGIYNESTGTSAGISQNRTITGNGISNVSNTGSGAAYGIYHTGSGSGGPHNVNSTTNTIGNVSSTGAGAAYGIYHTGSGSGGPHSYTDNANNISDIINSSNGAAYGIYNESNGSSTGINQNRTITGNGINNISNTGSGPAYGIYHTGSGSGGPHNVNSSTNTIGNVSSSGAGAAYGIYHTGSGSGGPHNVSRVTNNIFNISNNGSGNAYGIYHTGSGSGGPHVGVSRSNVIEDVSTSGGSGAAYGIYHTGSGSGGPHRARIIDNVIRNFSSNSDSAIGVRLENLDSLNLLRNKIVEFSTGSGTIEGVSMNSNVLGVKGLVANNVIGDFTTTSSNGSNDISGITLEGTTGTNMKFYYNSVYLAASSAGANFGSSAFTFAPGIPVDLRNNIFINKSNSSSGGGVRILNRTGALSASFLNTSNNNTYLVSDSLSANNFIYTDGTNSYQDFGQYRSAVGFENASFTEDVAFLSTDGSNADFLKIDGAIATRIESGGSVSNLGVLNDAAGNIRFGAVGYGGSGTATDIGAYEGNYLTSFHRWVGLVSSNWNVAGNWTGNILPNSNDDVVIAHNTVPQPSLTLADAACKNITFIHSGNNVPTITIPANRKLIANGDIIANGNFAGSGILELNSGVAQTISGITTAVNVDINNSNGVTINPLGRLNVSRELGLKVGVLTTNSNNLVITSSGSTAGYINDFAGGNLGSISGGVRVQRFVSQPLPASHTIASPVTNGSTVSQNYSDNFSVAGSPLGYVYNTNPNVTQPSPFPTTWWFDETLTAVATPGWVNGRDKVMTPGLGIMATIPQNRMIDVVGTANTGNYNIPVTRTDDGLNLIGNPYPSPISLNAMLSANSATILPFVYIWNKTNYAVYSSGGPGIWVNNIGAGTNDRLAHSQGFFVISNVPGSANVAMDNTMRTINQSHVYFATPQNECRIQLKEAGTESDELLIRTDGESNEEYDIRTDATKLLNEPIYSSTLYSLSKDNYALAINTLKDFDQDKIVPISIKSKTSGNKELLFNELESIDPSVNVYLEDASLGKFQDMRANPKYEVNLAEGNSGSRFFVHFSKKAMNNLSNTATESPIYASQNQLFVDLTNSKGTSEVRIYNSLGQMVEYKNISSSNGGKAQLNLNNLSGAYVVQLTSNGEVKNEKVVFGN